MPKLPLSFLKSSDLLGIHQSLTKFIIDSNFQRFEVGSLKKVILSIQKLIELEGLIQQNAWINSKFNSDERLAIYRKTIDSIIKYAKDQGFHLLEYKDKTIKVLNKKYWLQEYTKAYHVIMGLRRHLGFDPLFFRPLDDNIFSKVSLHAKENFARHHFRDNPILRLSLNIYDQILTDNFCHGKWGTLNEEQSSIIINNFERLLKCEGDITRETIERMFNNEENQWFYNTIVQSYWFGDSQFNHYCEELTRRRDFIESNSLQDFISNYYEVAYNRFYVNVIDNFGFQLYGILEMQHQVSRFTQVDRVLFNLFALTIDFGELYERILFDESG